MISFLDCTRNVAIMRKSHDWTLSLLLQLDNDETDSPFPVIASVLILSIEVINQVIS